MRNKVPRGSCGRVFHTNATMCMLVTFVPKNFVRYSDEMVKHLGCAPNMKNPTGVVAGYVIYEA